jgi:hypothetical protein
MDIYFATLDDIGVSVLKWADTKRNFICFTEVRKLWFVSLVPSQLSKFF